jgi:tetratricopeptide (TPR) repeat protein
MDSSSSEPVFLQTIADRLAATRNDYSDFESLLQAGLDIPLVDTRPQDDLTVEQLRRLQRARAAYIRPVLYGNADLPSVSVVIPIYGSAAIFAECLASLTLQSFVQQRPQDVQIILVEDGIPQNSLSVFEDHRVMDSISALSATPVQLTTIRLRANHGRAQARNVGISKALNAILMFIDGSMILEKDFIVEHLWRHGRLRGNVALLGFKENLGWEEFVVRRTDILDGTTRPDFRKDLKWTHTLSADEAAGDGFCFRGRHFQAGDVINYMQLTANLKALSGTEAIGRRTLPTFFQTNIVSLPAHIVLEIGGFEPHMQGWGLEDTLLGALLVATGCKLIPCPSAAAFNLETPTSGDASKYLDLGFNRRKYDEFVSKTRLSEYSRRKFDQTIAALDRHIEIVRLGSAASKDYPRPDVPPSRSISGVLATDGPQSVRNDAGTERLLNLGASSINAILGVQLRDIRTQYRHSGNPSLAYEAGIPLARLFDAAIHHNPYQLGCLHHFLGYMLLNANRDLPAIKTAERHFRVALSILEANSFGLPETLTRYLRCIWLLAITLKMQEQPDDAIDLIRRTLDDEYFRRFATPLDRLPLVRQLVLMDQVASTYRRFEEALPAQQLSRVEYFHSVRRLFEFALNSQDLQRANELYQGARKAFAVAQPYLESVHVWSFHKNLYHYFGLLKELTLATRLLETTLSATKRLGLYGQHSQIVSLANRLQSGAASDVRLDVARYSSTEIDHKTKSRT